MLINGLSDITLTLEFNRPVFLVMILSARLVERGVMPSLEGWKSEGEFEIEGGEDVVVGMGGDYDGVERELYDRVYAVSKVVDEGLFEIVVKKEGMGFEGVDGAIGTVSFVMGEKDGGASVEVEDVLKSGVKSGEKCPEELHDLWKVASEDEDVEGERFRTYHPQIDPFYWCYYGHEHGSDPGLSGYVPKFDYLAHKNEMEDETDGGFKGYLVDFDDYWFYTSLHAHVSSSRRFDTRFHSAVVAISNKEGDLMAELSCKSDMGFAGARGAEEGVVPLTDADAALNAQQRKERATKFRRFNVIYPEALDKRFMYREGDDLLHGEYEGWEGFGSELCADSDYDRHIGMTVDIKDSATAKQKAEDTAEDEPTILGRTKDGKLHPQKGLNRELMVLSNNFTISDKFCKFNLPDVSGGRNADGIFYTDPYCKKLLPGPGPAAVRQKIASGFEFTISGRYILNNIWDGSYRLRENKDEPAARFQNIDGSIYAKEN